MAVVPIDMLCYLVLVQTLPAIGLARDRDGDRNVGRFLLAAQSALIVGFLLVWGGYSKDSWDYLTGFDGNPFTYNDEWLFWILGYLLNKVVYDPWPLKLLSALGGALMCCAVLSYFKARGWRHAAAGMFALLLVPGFYLLMGSAIRQGLAGALVVLGIVNLHQDRKSVFAASTVVAYFLHQYSIILAVAGLLSRMNVNGARYALIAAPFASFAAVWLGSVFGVDVDEYIPHSDKQEGYFYWAKFFVSYSVVAAVLLITRRAEGQDAGMVAAYAYMVAGSALLLKYEVPFERLLSYSDLLLPLVAVICIDAIGWHRRRLLAGFWAAGVAAGIVLWSHPSIVATLGYSGA